MSRQSDEATLKVSQVCVRLAISRTTVRKYIASGLLQAKKLPTGRIRISRQSVELCLRDLRN